MSYDPKKVVILTINGHAGGKGGMKNLRNKLRSLLCNQLNIPKENIITSSWNHKHNATTFTDPLAFTRSPDIPDLIQKIKNVIPDPEYVALIGHSYGGRAACILSNALDSPPNYIALIDPVFGPTNHIIPDGETPTSDHIVNWYQTHGIGDWNPCLIIPDMFSNPLPFSMGFNHIPNAKNVKLKYKRDWDGNIIKANCGFFKAKTYLSHVNIDDDERLWRKVYETILADLS